MSLGIKPGKGKGNSKKSGKKFVNKVIGNSGEWFNLGITYFCLIFSVQGFFDSLGDAYVSPAG